MLNYIEEYYRQIKSGEIVASKRITKQYEKLIDDMYNHPQYIYDHAKAERPIKFIETFCRHSKGELAGKPLILDLFQKAYIVLS